MVTAAAYRSSLASCPSRVRVLCTTEDNSALLHLRPSTRKRRERGPGPGGQGCGTVGPGQLESFLTGFFFSIQVPEVMGEGRGESGIARLRRWVQSKVQWVRCWVKRIVWDWDGAA